MIDEDIARTGGRILLVMAAIGVGIALAAIFTAEWISTTIVPDLGPAEEEVVTAYTPLAFIIVAAFAAPIVAGLLGFAEGTNSNATKHAAVVGVACLAGAVVLLLIAGIGVSFADPSVDEITDDDATDDAETDAADDGDDDVDEAEPGVLDLFALAGLVGIAGLLTGALGVKVSGN